MRTAVMAIGLLSVALCGAATGWLTPTNPYSFTAGATVTYPGAETAWWVLNAKTAAAEADVDYSVAADGDTEATPGALKFPGTGARADDEAAYLTLGIGENGAGIEMIPTDPATRRLRVDKVHLTARFVLSDTTPDINALKQLYSSAYDRTQPDAAVQAAKLGLCVLQDGYFRIACVHGKPGDEATGLPEDFVFEFLTSPVKYDDLGGGDVTLTIEFQTFKAPGDFTPNARAFRVMATGEKDGTAVTYCLTEGIGYAWKMTETSDYQFDWSSFGQGEWLYAIDSGAWAQDLGSEAGTVVLGGDPNVLSGIAFSANAGSVLELWLEAALQVTTLADIKALSLNAAAFTPYLTQAQGFDAYVAWANEYDVNLAEYLPALGDAMLLSGSQPDADDAFDAFTLFMDPASKEPRILQINSMVPETEKVTLELAGPEGSDLSAALDLGISTVCVYRAESLDKLATALPQQVDLKLVGEGGILELPRYVRVVADGETKVVEQPFVKAVLVPTLTE